MIVRSAITVEGDARLRADLEALIPNLRAFAHSLAMNPADGDDLTQTALLKAWHGRAAFQFGTSLKNWLFTIARNQFYSDRRTSWRSTPLDPEVAEQTLIATDDPSMVVSLNEVRQALRCLTEAHREAVILVGAGGMSYDEAAVIAGCAVGTMKSRVSRGRDALAALISDGAFARDAQSAAGAFASIHQDFESLRENRPRRAA